MSWFFALWWFLAVGFEVAVVVFVGLGFVWWGFPGCSV